MGIDIGTATLMRWDSQRLMMVRLECQRCNGELIGISHHGWRDLKSNFLQ